MCNFAALHMSLPGTLLPSAEAASCPQLAKANFASDRLPRWVITPTAVGRGAVVHSKVKKSANRPEFKWKAGLKEETELT